MTETYIYEVYYDEAKQYLKSSEADRANIVNLIVRGHSVVQSITGKFEMTNPLGKNLVMSWVRFEFNGVGEHFDTSFQGDLSRLSFELWGDSLAEET